MTFGGSADSQKNASIGGEEEIDIDNDEFMDSFRIDDLVDGGEEIMMKGVPNVRGLGKQERTNHERSHA